jgi:hypothetical protein
VDIRTFGDGLEPVAGDGVEEGTLAQLIETVGGDLVQTLGKTGEAGLNGV